MMIAGLVASLLLQGDGGNSVSVIPPDLAAFDDSAGVCLSESRSLFAHPLNPETAEFDLLALARPWSVSEALPDFPAQDRASQDLESTADPHDSFTGFFETHFSSRAWKEYVWEDYLTEPSVLLPAGLALSAVLIHPWDKRLETHWHGLLGGKQIYSNMGQYILVGSAILTGILFPGDGRNAWDETWTIGESFAASSLTVAVLKAAVGRPRPGSTPGTKNGTHSFPSGHSTAAFTSATLIDRNSGPLVGIPAYLLAGFTAFERVEAGRHYPSDVLAGASIGALSAGIFDSLHWGKGPEGGIGRALADLQINFLDRLHGAELAWETRF
ncbi:MAG: phosphatase PAP2 family protein [Planctomycetaceae bacterium]|nr:phosphatase PAP2 family protein [Planctomycetaceae bacterium]